MTAPRHPTPGLRLRIVFPGGAWLGPGKADLLDGIAHTGSIRQAAGRLGMGYKRAWGLVEALNTMFPAPLIATSRGGADHGGASLTETGAEVLRHYRSAEVEAARAARADVAALTALSVISDGK
jgi:molybdate transport system regulatory protein